MSVKWSIKAKLQAIEKQFENINDPAGPSDPVVDKENLLFMDYEQYRSVFVEWLMSKYMQDHDKTALMEKKLEIMNNSLVPVTSSKEFYIDVFQDLLVKKIVDWMEANKINELDESRWTALQQELEGGEIHEKE